MHACTGGHAVLLEAVSPEGTGVLMRLRFDDSLGTGTYPILVPSDTVTQGAMVAVRYLLRDAAHAFYVDSGSVHVRRDGTKLGGMIQGSGIENGVHTPTRIQYHGVEMAAQSDTVSCVYRP